MEGIERVAKTKSIEDAVTSLTRNKNLLAGGVIAVATMSAGVYIVYLVNLNIFIP
ncbi:uncharacterized protein G2W53_020330 [Senna tora]|uniref:Uncharacterized protein n=1 Tax=Senna tora TaxID=362788 RepID=A0A834TZI8_9FABA|nr:uncharacterized protein G2W53_020330 [Senna tora]